jgi:hypothetical protein
MTKIIDKNGSIKTVIYTVPSVCANGTVENSDVSYTAAVASGGTLVLPDIDVDVNGVNEGLIPSVQDIDIILTDGTNPVTPDAVTIIGNTVTIEAPDATVENSDASYTDTVVSGGTLVLPDITVTDSDGSTFTQPSVTNVVCTLSPQDLTLYAPYATADDTISFTIITGSAGTITSADTTGLTSVTYDINGSPATLPFTLAVGDVLTIDFDTAGAGGVVILTGTYA